MMNQLAGQRFGKLTVTTFYGIGAYRQSRWTCQCDCGNIIVTNGAGLKNGSTKSCGCLWLKHGHAGRGKTTRTFQIWQSMWTRCSNPKDHAWKHYGGRGITVCEAWSDFRNFLRDMGECPPGLTLDRIDNNGKYEPSNCRWITQAEQARNRRNTKLSMATAKAIRDEYARSKISQRVLAGKYGVSQQTISNVLNRVSW